MYQRILVPIDGSETAERGLMEAIHLAQLTKSTLRLLNMTSDFALMVEMSGGIDFEQYRKDLNQFGNTLLEKASKLAAEHGVVSETLVRELRGTRVSQAIVDEARDSRCDLIVMGSHGRRGFNRAVLGSDAEAVLRASPVPVLIVRDPAQVA